MQKNNKSIFSTAYFPTVYYFSKLIRSDTIIIEQFEHYSKQSYRNRCDILSPNGKQSLSIPVKKKSGEKQLIKDVKIDYKNDWQSLHLKSLQTAYLSSPFYEFYMDAFMPFFEIKSTFLFDYNIKIIETLFSELQIEKKIEMSDLYNAEYAYPDYRDTIHPKNDSWAKDKQYQSIPYTQVFFDRFDFVRNLSILDLLFNEGPNSVSYL